MDILAAEPNYSQGVFVLNTGQEVLEPELRKLTSRIVVFTNTAEFVELRETRYEIKEESQVLVRVKNDEVDSSPVTIPTSSESEEVDAEMADIIILRGVMLTHCFPMSRINPVVRQKLLAGDAVTSGEKDTVLKVFADTVYAVEPSINLEKVGILAEQLVVTFPGLVERDENNSVIPPGYKQTAVSLETKISYIRRIKENVRTVKPRKFCNVEEVDSQFKPDKIKFDSFVSKLRAGEIDFEETKDTIKSLYGYQRVSIRSAQSGKALNKDSFKDLLQRWSFLLVRTKT